MRLVSNKERFGDFVYFPLASAIDEIERRWTDEELANKVNDLLGGDIPTPIMNEYKSVLFRPLFSPNYELLRFMKITAILGLNPLLLEYHDDKFTSLNPIKHCLGKMKFRQETIGKDAIRIKSKNTIDFNESQGKKIKEVQTMWGQPLIDFHHELMKLVIPNSSQNLFNASDWFHRMGGRAKHYYLKYIALFIRNGICFENFILEGDELRFVTEVFLPNFIGIWKLTEKKPIFVELLPRSTQSDSYWMSYPPQIRECIKKKTMVK